MKKQYAIGLFLFITLSVTAQNFEWLNTPAITFSYNSEGIGYPTATDAQGNTFVCGLKDNAMPYTDIFGNLWLLKYNATGQLLFSKTIAGSVCAYKMQTDAAGNLYVLGAYINDIAIDTLSITTTWQGVKPILLKFDTNGNLLWHKSISGDFVEHAKGLVIDSQQNVYLGYDNFMDSYIEKLDANGNTLQLVTQTRVKSVSSVSTDTEGNIYATGSCAETLNVDFNGSTVNNPFPYNTYIVKYNPSGQMQWMHFVEDVTCPEPQVIARTPDEVYFCSYLFGNYTFGNIPTQGPLNANSDFFLAKLNSSGNYQWVKEVPGNCDVEIGNRNFMTLDAAGNIYLAARAAGSVDWSPTVSTQIPTYTHDILVLKYNPQGEVLWAKTAGGNAEDRPDGITVLPDNSLILSGMVTGNVAFDALTHTASPSSTYPYITKLTNPTLGIHDPISIITTVYPNPFTDGFFLHLIPDAEASGNSLVNIKVYDMLGRTIEQFQLPVSALESTTMGNQYQAGVYNIVVSQDDTMETVRVVKR